MIVETLRTSRAARLRRRRPPAPNFLSALYIVMAAAGIGAAVLLAARL
jgi:hypothetical protein